MTATTAPPELVAKEAERAGGRDLRLDFFRGLGLLFIFVDHVPDNWVSYLTLANVVFCDSAEIFVFISGISAALVFGRLLERESYVFAVVQVLRRTWTLYVAHVFLFVIFTAQVAYAARRWNNPMFAEEMNVAGFLEEPGLSIIKALTLQFQPMFMGILPLYIVLLLGLAACLPLLRRFAEVFLVASAALWTAVQFSDVNLAAYPSGKWFHNPAAWQLLFTIGVAVGFSRHVHGRRSRMLRRPPIALSAAILGMAVIGKLALTFGTSYEWTPDWLADRVWRFGDKTNLGPLRLVSFLALALVVSHMVKPGTRWLASDWAKPIVRCGQNSLGVFCFGIFLSVAAHALLVEYGHGSVAEGAVSFGGCAILVAVAWFLDWAKRRERALAARSPLRVSAGAQE